MKWPWVARSAFEEVQGERDRLRVQVDELLAHVRRMDRVEHGLHELEPHRKPEPEPMPEEVEQEIARWDSETIRQRLTDEAWQAYRRDRSWKSVLRRLQQARNGRERHETPAMS